MLKTSSHPARRVVKGAGKGERRRDKGVAHLQDGEDGKPARLGELRGVGLNESGGWTEASLSPPKREGGCCCRALPPTAPWKKKGAGRGKEGDSRARQGRATAAGARRWHDPPFLNPRQKGLRRDERGPLCAPFGVPPRRLPCPLKRPGVLCQGDVFVVLGQAASWRRRAPARRIKKPWRVDGLMGWREQRGRGRGGGGPLPPRASRRANRRGLPRRFAIDVPRTVHVMHTNTWCVEPGWRRTCWRGGAGCVEPLS